MKNVWMMAVVVALAASTAMGQGRGEGKRWGGPGGGMGWILTNPELAREAGITDEQVATLREDGYAMRRTMIKQNADLEIARLDLDHLTQQATPDAAAINKAVEEVGRLQTEIEKARIQHRMKTEQLLGKETLTKLRDAARERREASGRKGKGPGRGEGHKRGPGGPCMPPPEAEDDVPPES